MARKTQTVGVREGVQIVQVTELGPEDVQPLLREADLRAGRLRELLVPPGAGIELTYAEKNREALEFVAESARRKAESDAINANAAPGAAKHEPEPMNPAEFPFIYADALVDEVSLDLSAAAILTRVEVFRIVGPVIEMLRRGARKRLVAETNPAKAAVILNSVSQAELVKALKARGLTDAQLTELMSGAR